MSEPWSFVKTFVYDYAEQVEDIVNEYAKIEGLEIVSISVCYTSVFVATVVFERGYM